MHVTRHITCCPSPCVWPLRNARKWCVRLWQLFVKKLRRTVCPGRRQRAWPIMQTPSELVAEFSGMEVAYCFFHLAKKVRDKAPMLRSFYKPVIIGRRRVRQLPSATVH